MATDNPVFTPPFLGSRVVKGIPIDEIAGFLNETALFRNQWQFRPEKGESDEDFKARIRPQLERLGMPIEEMRLAAPTPAPTAGPAATRGNLPACSRTVRRTSISVAALRFRGLCPRPLCGPRRTPSSCPVIDPRR